MFLDKKKTKTKTNKQTNLLVILKSFDCITNPLECWSILGLFVPTLHHYGIPKCIRVWWMRSEPYTTVFSSVAEETCHPSLELPPLLWTACIMIQKVNQSGMFTLKICCLRLSVSGLKGNSLCIHPQIFLEIKHLWWSGILTF